MYYAGLVILGLVVGVLSGLFGVGGGFLLVPMLNVVFNVPYNIAIGSSLCQMVGTSIAACIKHKDYGHIDYKLAGFILIGAVAGAELGARVLTWMKGLEDVVIHGHSVSGMYLWVNIIYVALLFLVGICMFIESSQAKKRAPQGGVVKTGISQRIQNMLIPPKVSLPVSNISAISVWSVIVLGMGVGILSGLLGLGGGVVVNPSLIYLVGVPTNIAIGTGLFQIIFTSGYGALTHFLKGNVDFILVACILSGSLVGSVLGATLSKNLRGAHIRYYFSWIVFVTIGIILFKFLLNTGYLGG